MSCVIITLRRRRLRTMWRGITFVLDLVQEAHGVLLGHRGDKRRNVHKYRGACAKLFDLSEPKRTGSCCVRRARDPQGGQWGSEPRARVTVNCFHWRHVTWGRVLIGSAGSRDRLLESSIPAQYWHCLHKLPERPRDLKYNQIA